MPKIFAAVEISHMSAGNIAWEVSTLRLLFSLGKYPYVNNASRDTRNAEKQMKIDEKPSKKSRKALLNCSVGIHTQNR